VRALLKTVSQAGGMPQQVDDQHWARWRFGQKWRRSAGLKHAEVLPFRDVLMDGLVERDAAFLDQHHEGDRSERLGHRIDSENGVVAHRRLALNIREPLY